jgi:hypothetical protein
MRKLFNIFLIVCSGLEVKGQTVSHDIIGKVSFVSSRNVYVKFSSTSGIATGDTLFITSGDKMIPALVVQNLSSISCVCQQISSEIVPVDHLVIARAKIYAGKSEEKTTENRKQEVVIQQVPSDTTKVRSKEVERKQNIHGSLSLNSYSDFSNTAATNSQNFRYVFSLDARNIGNSDLSLETYLSFQYKAGDWQAVKSDIFNGLKIYSLALKYDINKSMKISLGRKINPKLSNIGPMDGIQFEASIKRFTLGAVSGFRPDYKDFGFDPKLFQFGGYVSFDTKNESRFTQTSLALMQQMNGSNTDRRFLYFQHANALGKNLYFFGTFEADLYKLLNDKPTTTFDMTGLYLSLRYRVTKSFSISGSYDARKNVVYYETYKSYLDYMLETEMRQGFRLQANYRISPELMAGLSSGFRFLKSDPHPSENLYGYFTWSQLSGLKLIFTGSGTYLQTGFTNGVIAGANVSRGFFDGKLISEIGYRYVDYTLPETSSKLNQNEGEVDLSMQLSRKLFISAYYEGTFGKIDRYTNIYLQFRIRF